MPLIECAKLPTYALEKGPTKVVVTIFARLQIIKTELVLTVATSHMIAAFVLVANNGTLWTVDGSRLLLPLLKLYIFFTLATLPPYMSLLSTWEAYFSEALITLDNVLLLFCTPMNVVFTRGFGTPSKIGIQVDYGISLEAHILIKQ